MAEYINLYMNNPTAGGTDGTAVSTNDTETNPVSVTLDATKNEEKVVTLALRTEEGYKTSGDTVISFDGTTKDKWQVSETADGSFNETLTISDSIGTTNKLFYVKATSSSDEKPSNDKSVNIKVSTKIEAV
ncbi:hypothetical protein SELR_18120 [Selenomonas ruminantium subsp. lactilytica TAM6421]|uniref:Uncharacterized protein n=1 Tax=Selenomonas ruminantium subsp. lactilytica (strain NBRC 103574 / TAM6421) TaxID=927704 RepID=I0GRY3_SELRL|nr:hypothetical protein [Selenomonas ruminantium]BAL83520.1 hypothetical protein SELR_18120 [Selenomonas ruminantium subsp. lactilytica TAM6421]